MARFCVEGGLHGLLSCHELLLEPAASSSSSQLLFSFLLLFVFQCSLVESFPFPFCFPFSKPNPPIFFSMSYCIQERKTCDQGTGPFHCYCVNETRSKLVSNGAPLCSWALVTCCCCSCVSPSPRAVGQLLCQRWTMAQPS